MPLRTQMRMAVPATNMEERHPEALLVLLDVSALLRGLSSLDDVLKGILDLAGKILSADAYAVWRVLGDGCTWKAIAVRGLSPGYRTQFTASRDRAITSLQAVEDVTTELTLARFRHSYAAEGIRSLLAVPFVLKNDQRAAITFYWRRPHSFNSVEFDYASALANVCTAALNANDFNEVNEREKRRVSFLAEASAILNSSFDYETNLRAIAQLAVPQIADWCTVHVLESGEPHRIAMAHSDSGTLNAAAELFDRYPEEILPDRGLGGVLRTGKRELRTYTTSGLIDASAPEPNHLAAMRKMGIASSLTVPLVSGGRVVGAIRLLAEDGRPNLDGGNLQLAEGLARRAADAIETSQLHRDLLRQQNELQLLHSAARIGRWGWNLQTGDMFWSDEYKQLLGLPAKQSFIGTGQMELIHPDDRERIQEELNQALASGAEQIILEYRVLTSDQQTCWIQSRGAVSRDPEGNPVSILGISMDVTQSRRAEDALRFSEREAARRNNEVAAIVQSSDDAIVSKDLTGRIMSWNPAAERIFGYSQEEILGKSIRLLIPEELQAQEEEILNKIRSGQTIDHFETVRVTKSGERIDASLSISPVRDEKGTIIGASKTLRDISGRKRLEASLLQAEKIAAAGKMAAAVAHEVNNPLEAITNLIFLAREHAGDSAQVRSFLDLAESEVSRVSRIAQRTLGFYRENNSVTGVSPADLVEHTLRIYEPQCRTAGISIERDFKSKRSILTRSGEILQVIFNIVANAIHAMPSGGVLSISTEDVELPAGAGIRIAVRDNGVGIPAHQLPRIFDAFFSPRPGTGTGIGLFVARQFVIGHGGRIDVESSADPASHGTTMSVYLPLGNQYSAGRSA